MSVSCECRVFSGKGLCVGLITYPGELGPTECGVSDCDREARIMRRPKSPRAVQT